MTPSVDRETKFDARGLRKSLPTAHADTTYYHRNGWLIVRQTRDWSLRGFPRGALGGTEATAGPKTYWVVIDSRYRDFQRELREAPESFPRLRDAAAWCDEHLSKRLSSLTVLRFPQSEPSIHPRP